VQCGKFGYKNYLKTIGYNREQGLTMAEAPRNVAEAIINKYSGKDDK
jgi:hypothetical protein